MGDPAGSRRPSPCHRQRGSRHAVQCERSMSVTPASAPSLELDRGFVVASGIECSAPLIAGGVRQDELRKTGHWDRYREDLELVASFGIRYLRYGVPFHVVAREPDPA